MWLGTTTAESDQRMPIASVRGHVLEALDQIVCDEVPDALATVDQYPFDGVKHGWEFRGFVRVQ
jgi:hypothetical protein